MNRTQRFQLIAEIATAQWGLITTGQAVSAGIAPKHVIAEADAGTLHRVRHGVYRITGAPWHPHEELRAAWLAINSTRTAAERLTEAPESVVSHRSAAAMHGLGDAAADELEFTCPRRRQSKLLDQRFHTAAITPGEITRIDGLPVTTPLRTVTDLADDVLDGGHLAGIVNDALNGRHVTHSELAMRLAPFSRRYGLPRNNGERLLEHLQTQRADVA